MSEHNETFWKRMVAAMEFSKHKYGPIKDAYPHKVNALKSLKERLKLYEETGSGEYLVDVANFAMIEFTLPAHETFNDRTKDGGTGRKWHAGGPSTERDNYGRKVK